jgi:hypothetical protein
VLQAKARLNYCFLFKITLLWQLRFISKSEKEPDKASEQRKGLINASNMVILSCSVIAVVLVVDKRTMQQLTEHFKFSSRHGDV